MPNRQILYQQAQYKVVLHKQHSIKEDSAKQQRRYPQHKESSFVSKNKEHNMAKSKRPPRPKSNAFQSSNSVKSPDDPGMLSTVFHFMMKKVMIVQHNFLLDQHQRHQHLFPLQTDSLLEICTKFCKS